MNFSWKETSEREKEYEVTYSFIYISEWFGKYLGKYFHFITNIIRANDRIIKPSHFLNGVEECISNRVFWLSENIYYNESIFYYTSTNVL